MDSDEREICIYLRSCPGQFVSGREIARRAAGKRRYKADPNWAAQVLTRLVEKGVIDDDRAGHYRLRPKEKRLKPRKWVSPQLRRILEQSGKDFTEITDTDDLDDF